MQAVVLPLTDRQNDYGHRVFEELQRAGLRAEIDDRSEKVNLKIREAQLQKIPYMLVVGGREEEAGQVAVRHRKHGDQGVRSIDAFISGIQQQVSEKVPVE